MNKVDFLYNLQEAVDLAMNGAKPIDPEVVAICDQVQAIIDAES